MGYTRKGVGSKYHKKIGFLSLENHMLQGIHFDFSPYQNHFMNTQGMVKKNYVIKYPYPLVIGKIGWGW